MGTSRARWASRGKRIAQGAALALLVTPLSACAGPGVALSPDIAQRAGAPSVRSIHLPAAEADADAVRFPASRTLAEIPVRSLNAASRNFAATQAQQLGWPAADHAGALVSIAQTYCDSLTAGASQEQADAALTESLLSAGLEQSNVRRFIDASESTYCEWVDSDDDPANGAS